jgi:hypothetical protein
MHRIIARAGPDDFVDHRDENGLNNRRDNLRICTHAQNLRNRQKPRGRKTSSRFKGVTFAPHNKSKPWMAQLKVDYKRLYLGYYATEEEAAEAYNKAALLHHGDFANLNVIEGQKNESTVGPGTADDVELGYCADIDPRFRS